MSYTLVEELGKGGMGVVWKAKDDDTGQLVALKLLNEAFSTDDDYRQRFEHEMAIARRIDSPHVVKVLGYGEREGVPYIAFELVEGPSLRQLLKSHGPYTWPEARVLILQLAEGLADAHATGVVHRDVKPSNVLIAPDGTVKLADFGISHAVDMTRLTQSSGVMGTPSYVAPEGPVDARSDLYSLGVVLYEVLTGSPPFKGSTYHEVLAAHMSQAPDLSPIPAEQRPLLGWLLAKDPSDRPQTAHQLIRALLGEEKVPEVDSQTTIAMRARAMTAPAAAVPAKVDQAKPVAPSPVAAPPQPVAAPPQPVVAPPPAKLPATTPAKLPAVTPAKPLSIPVPLPPAERTSRVTPPVIASFAVVLVVVLAAGWLLVGGHGSPSATPSPIAVATPTATASPTEPPSPTPVPTPTPSPTPAKPLVWTTVATLSETAFGDGAEVLKDGRVIIFSTTQGTGHTATQNTWIFDPSSNGVVPGPKMAVSQSTVSSAKLKDGSVMVVGGWDSQVRPVTSAELLDPSGTSWQLLAPMNLPRSLATITELPDGRVLVAGGWTHKNGSDSWTATNTAEVYDRTSNTWTLTSNMPTPVALGAAALMGNGKVLVTGGDADWPSGNGQVVLGSSEIYDPATNAWSLVTAPGYRAAQFAEPLPNGQVLVAGGWADGQELGLATAASYDPATNTWTTLPDMPDGHAQGRSVVLSDGRVMILGGWDSTSTASSNVDVYDPSTEKWSRLASTTDATYWPCAVELNDGRVLVAGGWRGTQASHRIEILE